MRLALHTYVLSLPRKSSESDLSATNIAFEVSLASNDGSNLDLYHIRIPRLQPSF